MTDKAKLYAVKNDEGEWMSLDGTKMGIWYSNNPTLFKDKSYAEAQSMGRKAHVVELTDAPAKVVVSEEEAEMLKKANDTTVWRPAAVISDYAYNAAKDSNQEVLVEDRLMRAYVIGWTVDKPKQWNVKVPHVKGKMYYKDGRGSDGLDIASADYLNDKNQRFTAAEIEHYELTDCERVEVTGDEQ